MNGGPLVQMRGISKYFGAVRALHNVNLTILKGEVHGLVGDNGAGKSTLMKILSGALRPDRGRIVFEGKEVRFRTPLEARQLGIEMIYQDLALVPQLTVSQNVFLGREVVYHVGFASFLRKSSMDEYARDVITNLGIAVPSMRSKIRELSGGQQQAVAIARAIAFEAKLIIMDEPTAALGASALAKVREAICNLREMGISVVVISHRIEDIFAVCNHVTVLKHGEVVGTRPVAETTPDEVIEMIVSGTYRSRSQGHFRSRVENGGKGEGG